MKPRCLSCDKLIEKKDLKKVEGLTIGGYAFHIWCYKRIEANKQEKERRSGK